MTTETFKFKPGDITYDGCKAIRIYTDSGYLRIDQNYYVDHSNTDTTGSWRHPSAGEKVVLTTALLEEIIYAHYREEI